MHVCMCVCMYACTCVRAKQVCMYVCMYEGDVDGADLCYQRALALEPNRCACMYVYMYVYA